MTPATIMRLNSTAKSPSRAFVQSRGYPSTKITERPSTNEHAHSETEYVFYAGVAE